MPAVRCCCRNGTGTAASAIGLKFLIDNALPHKLADLLSEGGYDAVQVRTYRMQAAKDEEISAPALEEDRIVVSADSDFGTILAMQDFTSSPNTRIRTQSHANKINLT